MLAQKENQNQFMVSNRLALATTSIYGGWRETATSNTQPNTWNNDTRNSTSIDQRTGQRNSQHEPQTRLEEPVPKCHDRGEEDVITLTKREMKDLFTSFVGALAVMLGQQI